MPAAIGFSAAARALRARGPAARPFASSVMFQLSGAGSGSVDVGSMNVPLRLTSRRPGSVGVRQAAKPTTALVSVRNSTFPTPQALCVTIVPTRIADMKGSWRAARASGGGAVRLVDEGVKAKACLPAR